MGLKDLIITPVYFILFMIIAYLVRPHVTDAQTKKYFLPALMVRFICAILLGMLYQFYYDGGDTFNYFHQGSILYEAFIQDPMVGLNMIFRGGVINTSNYEYASRIYWFYSPPDYFIVKIIGVFSLFTFNTYSAVALFFGLFSFVGVWLIYSCIEKDFKRSSNWLAWSILFFPTVIFWGSGVLKDSIALGAIGVLFWSSYLLIEKRKYALLLLSLMFFSAWVIFTIKVYIILCYIPCVFFWWYLKSLGSIRSVITKMLLLPIFASIFLFGGFYVLKQVSKTSDRYRLDALAKWSYITSYDIRYWTGKDAGSGYDIGKQDGSWQTLFKLLPSAINVALFRPYLWEVKNILMLLSALESLVILLLTLRALPRIIRNPYSPLLIFLIVFSLSFAFAVGAATYNFGTLSRYKIPLLPFYLSALVLMRVKRAPKKLDQVVVER